ncbi:hypothetical protein [Paenirhodobacter sp.]|uniref:hypothetical protein n=1 Tax=Paenirhodobacter sp. TaxID=1965326 RepID=UPI003B410804
MITAMRIPGVLTGRSGVADHLPARPQRGHPDPETGFFTRHPAHGSAVRGVEQEFARVPGLDPEGCQRFGGEVREVLGHEHTAAPDDGDGQHMPVVGIGLRRDQGSLLAGATGQKRPGHAPEDGSRQWVNVAALCRATNAVGEVAVRMSKSRAVTKNTRITEPASARPTRRDRKGPTGTAPLPKP